jgi:hypothetical protein
VDLVVGYYISRVVGSGSCDIILSKVLRSGVEIEDSENGIRGLLFLVYIADKSLTNPVRGMIVPRKKEP